MAYQPAGRGGERHFTAGNIRIVSEARKLVEDKAKRDQFTGNQHWTDKQWKKALLKVFKMKKSDEGKLNREQLVLYGQTVYSCVCGSFV
jgi:hypothetical protein